MSIAIDAISAHFQAAIAAGGLGLGWGDPVWTGRMQGNGVITALGQPLDILSAQTVLTPFAQQRAPVGDRWLQYAVEVARYSFDYAQAQANAEQIMQAYDTWKGNTSCTPPFTIPGCRARLRSVENLQVVGPFNSDGEAQLWKAVVKLYFVNLEMRLIVAAPAIPGGRDAVRAANLAAGDSVL